jgi:hypothetical protein
LVTEALKQTGVPKDVNVRTAVELKLSQAVTMPTQLIKPTHPGRRPTGGIELESSNTTEVKIVTWNITALTSANASDHAEDQFVEWLREKKSGK